MHSGLRTRSVSSLAVVLAALVVLQPAAAYASSASDSPSGPVAAQGTWNDTDPLTIVDEQPVGVGVLLTATGSSTWSGTLTGTTQFTVRALFDPTGRGVGTIDETFVGTVAGVGSGRVHFSEAAVQSPDGSLRILAVTTSATGDLTGLTGLVQFVGSTDPTGAGGGTYAGTLVLTS